MFWKCLVVLMLVAVAVVPVAASDVNTQSYQPTDYELQHQSNIMMAWAEMPYFEFGSVKITYKDIPNKFEVSGGLDLGSPLQ